MKKTILLLLAVTMLLSLAACANQAAPADETPDWQTQYDLGVRYLSEGNYEEAILAFNAAIEIDPKNPDAYIKLAEVYEQTGDDEAALRTLEQGFSETQSERLTQEENRIKRKILQENPAVAELPAAVDSVEEPEASTDEETGELLAYIDTLPHETVANSALKIVDAYADMLNSTDSGEGIFYPDETDTDRFWTAIYLFEVNQRKYFDENGPISRMIKDGFLIDSRQNVQDIANAMYGKVVDLPPLDDRWSVRQIDGDSNYYFGLSDRGAIQVTLDSFEQLEDGSATLKLSYSYPADGPYMTAAAKLRVNPNVNLDGEIPFYYMIESVEIRYV